VLLRQHAELLRCGQTSPVVAHLPFADHVHKVDAAQNDPRTTEVLEATKARSSATRARGDCRMTNENTSAYLTKQVEKRTTDVGRRICTTAQTLHTIAEQLRGDVNTHAAADFADRGADIFDRIGSYLENSALDVLISDAEDFSRERPWAVAATGIAAGLLAARLLKSTAARRHMLAESQFTTTNPADGSDVADHPNVDTAMLPARGSPRRQKPRAIADGI
jgi:hypothetical protein